MTIAPPAETAIVEEVDAGQEPEPVGFRPEQYRQIAIRAVVVVVVLVVLILFFEYPVAQTWYHARQRQLLSQFLSPQARLGRGQAAALLQIPKLGQTTVVVVQGDGAAELRSGPGHRPGTPLPGHRGNSIILGHHTSWGGPFGNLAKLHRKNILLVQTRGSKPVVYIITAVKHVSATDTRISAPTKEFRLTLVTGDGSLLSGDRLVIQAVSGDSVKPTRARGPILTVTHGSLILNPAVAIAAVALTVAGITAAYLRRHYGLLALFAVLTPLVLAGLFALLVDLDLLLPPLR